MTIRLDDDRLSITMNPKHFSFYLTLVVALLALMIAAGCTNEVPKVTEGTLTVRIADANSRGIEPSISMLVSKYKVAILNSQNVVEKTAEVESAVSTIDFKLKAGDYTVTVEALNDEETTIGIGSSSISVVAGDENSVTVNVSECKGEGTFSVAIEANSGYALDLVIYDLSAEEVVNDHLVYDNGTFVTSEKIVLPNGFYLFAVIRTDTGEAIKEDSLRIIKDSTSSYMATFTLYSDGSLSIVNEVLVVPEVELTLNKVKFTSYETLTASADVTGLEDYSSYWIVDGIPFGPFGIYEDLSLDLSDLGLGDHEVMFMVSKGKLVWSQSAGFEIYKPDGDMCQENGSSIQHAWKVTKVVPPTHTAEGYTEYECTVCGATKKVVAGKVEDHKWAESWSEETRDGHRLLYNACLVPGCDEKQYFGYQFAKYFEVTENGVLEYHSYAGTLEDFEVLMIPTKIGDRIVTAIGDYLFDYYAPMCFTLWGTKKVVIPPSVEVIGKGVFQRNNSMEVILPDSVTTIDDAAFYQTGLKNIVIPSSVKTIGVGAFEETDLTSLFIPSSVEQIGENAFKYCSHLQSVVISPGVTEISPYIFAFCDNLTSVTLPEGLLSIGDSAFEACYNLSEINIPSTVTNILSCAFLGTDIRSIVIPSGVTVIRECTCRNCRNLERVELPSGITSIGDEAFYGCTSLSTINIPDTVESIGVEAFLNCSSLSGIVLPSGIKAIGDGTFAICSKLESIEIPDSVTSIGDCAFSNAGLKDISFGSQSKLETIGELAFSNCTGLTSFTVPDGVTQIGKSAFSGCTGLTSFIIPDGVIQISESTFSGCSYLESITIPKTVKKIDFGAFNYCYKLTTINFTGTEAEWADIDKEDLVMPYNCTVLCSDTI